jgi:pimeloyl-ACP methyl ester carboxylesterase
MSDEASATPVALVHGVGFGPSTFALVERELRRTGPVVMVERRGYGRRAALAPPGRVEDHVDDLVAALDAAGIERAVVAGVSGGATVALAAALMAPDRVVAAVAHEPAVGTLVPELLTLISSTMADGGGCALVRALAGPATWARLTASETALLAAGAALFEADSRAYLAWEPELDDVPDGAPVTTTVGELSNPLRHTVASRLEEHAGARVVVIPDCGHLAQIDAPLAFAAVISDAAARHAVTTELPTLQPTYEEQR